MFSIEPLAAIIIIVVIAIVFICFVKKELS